MKRLKNIFTVFLSGLILLVSLNITISRMVCVESGHVKISLSALKDCCPEKKQEAKTVIKALCCDISTLHVQVKDAHFGSKHQLPQTIEQTLIAVPVTNSYTGGSHASIQTFPPDPVPFSSRELLSLHAVLRI